jgi:protein gp37
VVFVNSMSDIAHARVPGEAIARIWAVMALTRRHTFQVLTKRPKRLAALLLGPAFAREVGRQAALIAGQLPSAVPGTADGLDDWTPFAGGYLMPPWPLPNVWVGTSIENDDYTWRADDLRQAPAAVRFLSLEPLLGPLPSLNLDGISWVIVGGESGTDHRTLDLAWARGIRDRCASHDIDFFFKQIGGPTPKAGGRLLDGRTWDQMPPLVGSTR